MKQPIIVPPHDAAGPRVEIDGQTICIHEWRGSGPATMHVHREDDEAWHVLEGELCFRFSDRTESLTPTMRCLERATSSS